MKDWSWDRYWYGPVAAARPFLFSRLFLLMLGFDCWNIVWSGGRYGSVHFNVAHFAWLDALQPVPGPATYVVVMLAAGLLSFVLGCVGPRLVPGLILCGLYTYGWMMSMLDSYQHHYLCSLVLLLLAFFPSLTVDDVQTYPPAPAPAHKKKGRGHAPPRALPKPQLISAWPWALLLFTCAVVYAYTAVSKSEPDWRSGDTLRSITAPRGSLLPLEHLFEKVGLGAKAFWTMMGFGTIAIQVTVSSSYLLAPRRDTLESRVGRLWPLFGLGAALSFHFGAEYLHLRVGWFSYYMIVLAVLAFAPANVVTSMARLAPRLPLPKSRGVALALTAAAAAAFVVSAVILDLPGAMVVAAAGAIVVLATAGWLLRAGRARAAAGVSLAAGSAALFMAAWIATGDQPLRFYSRWAVEARRAGDTATADAAMGKLKDKYTPQEIREIQEKEVEPQ